MNPNCTKNLIPQKKGQPSINPKGRPPASERFADIARDYLNAKAIDVTVIYPDKKKNRRELIQCDKSFYHAVAIAMIKKAMAGDVRAQKELIDRTDGKVADKVEIDRKGDNPLKYLSDADIMVMLARIKGGSPDQQEENAIESSPVQPRAIDAGTNMPESVS